MITITPAKESDIKDILAKYDTILSQNMNELKYENTMLLVEQGKIYGISSYTLIDNFAHINVLYIDENKRRLKFGDSLIKATLNLIDRRDIKKAYIIMDDIFEDFLKSASLIKSSFEEYGKEMQTLGLLATSSPNKKVVYIAILPDFFNTACRSSHKN